MHLRFIHRLFGNYKIVVADSQIRAPPNMYRGAPLARTIIKLDCLSICKNEGVTTAAEVFFRLGDNSMLASNQTEIAVS
ncbi:hypothetical protein MTP99_016712 [Tenebrio molitor]|jgi:hypothetical protein|nr:hypothetical protein MTP99_016712 [Tenebrio molitor]